MEKRSESYKVLSKKAFAILNDPEYNGYQCGLVLIVYELFNKTFNGSGINSYNQQIANELQ